MSGRRFSDSDGNVWVVRIISSGRTSAYLNPRVHRPVLEFRRVGGGTARYAALRSGLPDALEDIEEADLIELLARSRTH